jgi:hypothetical protein
LTTIISKVKLLHIEMHMNTFWQNACMWQWKILDRTKIQKGFWER